MENLKNFYEKFKKNLNEKFKKNLNEKFKKIEWKI